MFKRLAVAALVAAFLPSASPAAPATTTAKEVRAALDYFCKPYLSGETTTVRSGAVAAGWTEYGIGQHFRDGGWGRVNVNFKPDRSCGITVPVGGSRDKELAILDATGLWAKANGFTVSQARGKTTGPLYDTVSEAWARGGNTLKVYGYINRRKADMLIPDVEIYVK
jgi:hypothetical protein